MVVQRGLSSAGVAVNKAIDMDLFDWIDYWGRAFDSSYSGRTPLGRLLDEGWAEPPPPGSCVPRGALSHCPPHVTRLNRVMDSVPDRYAEVLKLRYIDHRTLSRGDRTKLHQLHAFLEGALCMLE